MSDDELQPVADPAGDTDPLAKAYEVIVAGSPIAGTSTQPAPDKTTPDEAVIPPLSMDALAQLSAISSVRAACIEAIARNVVGLGFDVVPRAHEKAAADLAERRAEAVRVLDALAGRDERLGRPSFTGQLFAVKTDEEEVGLGALEVSRNVTTGKIDGLFHLPGKRLRRRKDQTGWMLVGAGGQIDDPVSFYNFGEKVEYTAGDDPQPTGDLVSGKKASVNEVIVFRLYSSESRDYGLPRDAALALEYAADKLAAESNLSFFDSSGVAPTILFVAGEEDSNGQRVTVRVPNGTVERIAQTVKSDGGHKRAVAIVPLPAGTKVQSVQLAQRSDRDIANNEFRSSIAGRVLGAFRLPPIFVPGVFTDNGGRFTAEVQRALALEQVFDPEAERYVSILDAVLRDLGYADLRLRFDQLAIEGGAAKRDSANALALTRAITNAEQRLAHGYGRLPESDSDDPIAAAAEGKVAKGWNDALVESPKAAAVAQQPYGGANDGPDAPRPDQRGLQPGLAQRDRIRQETGDDGQPLAKHDRGVDHVDAEVDALQVEFLELSDDAIQRGMARTMTVADVVAGRVADVLADRQSELDAAPR